MLFPHLDKPILSLFTIRSERGRKEIVNRPSHPLIMAPSSAVFTDLGPGQALAGHRITRSVMALVAAAHSRKAATTWQNRAHRPQKGHFRICPVAILILQYPLNLLYLSTVQEATFD